MFEQPDESKQSDEFFVGYLKTPHGLGRFLRAGAIVLLIVGGALAAALAASQRDPGLGAWDVDHATVLEGLVQTEPCPLIRVAGQQGQVMTILLVSQGKLGAAERLAPFNGQLVRVRGHTLERGRVRMFELDDDAKAVEAVSTNTAMTSMAPRTLALPAPSDRRAVTLRGEIVDPKCFAGAMKPGEGKTHKACAVLCLRGGIPPMFVAEDGRAYLLVDENGRSPTGGALEAILPKVGEFGEFHGQASTRGDVNTFCQTEK